VKGLLVIPAYNEAANIGGTILCLRDAEVREEILVVNDGSNDGTAQILEGLGVLQITHEKNKGYLGALRTGMNYARAKDYDYVVFFDADGQHDAGDLVRFRDKLRASGGPDIVTGSRFVPGPGIRRPVYRAPIGRKAGMVLFSHLTGWLSGQRIYDTTCGFKALTRRALDLVYDKEFGDFHAEMLIFCIIAGLRVEEIPVVVHERVAGDSMYDLAASLKYPFRTMRAIAKLYPAARRHKSVSR
jgi:glycosyltransferase involved in cell wall biosynthesis